MKTFEKFKHTNCPRADCFGCRNGKCRVLTESATGSAKCAFYKTESQYMADKAASAKRILSLDGGAELWDKYHANDEMRAYMAEYRERRKER